MALWSYHAGRKGVNRVTARERREGGPLQLVVWAHDVRSGFGPLIGRPAYVPEDEELACAVADQTAAKLRNAGTKTVVMDMLGLSPARTLEELLHERHEDRKRSGGRLGQGWAEQTERNQGRLRTYWLEILGRDRPITEINAPLVRRLAHDFARQRGMGTAGLQSLLVFIKDAMGYAHTDLQWIGPMETLSALKIPKYRAPFRTYELPEGRALLSALHAVDPRAGMVGEVMWSTGRRQGAIRKLPAVAPEPVLVEGRSYEFIEFPATTDKARKLGRALLTPEASQAIRKLLDYPGVQASGFLCPRDALDDPLAASKVMDQAVMNKLLRRAERLAGIKTVKGRSWHAFKKLVASAAPLRGVSQQSGTTKETLTTKYVGEDLLAKAKAVDVLGSLRAG